MRYYYNKPRYINISVPQEREFVCKRNKRGEIVTYAKNVNLILNLHIQLLIYIH